MKNTGLFLVSLLSILNGCGFHGSSSSDVESTGSIANLQSSSDLANLKLTGVYAKYSDQAVKALSAVGLLSSGKSVCTAFAVGPTVAITSGHCLASGGSDCKDVKITWSLPDSSGKTQKASSCVQVLQYANKDGQGDYAVLKLDSGPESGAFVSWEEGNPLATRGALALIAGYTAENKLQVTTQCSIDAGKSTWQGRQKASVQELFRRNYNCAAFQGMSGALVFELDSQILRPVGVHSGQSSGDGKENMTNLAGFLGSSKRLSADVFSPAALDKAIQEGKGRAICQESYADFLYGKLNGGNDSQKLTREDENNLREWFASLGPVLQETNYKEWIGQLSNQQPVDQTIATQQSLCSQQLPDVHTNPFGNDACKNDTGGQCRKLGGSRTR